MDYDALHAKARAVMPSVPKPPGRYMVAVLLLHKPPQERLIEDDFFWMPPTDRESKVAEVQTQYMQKYPDTDIELQLNGKMPTSGTALKLFDYYRDELVVFQSVAKDLTDTLGTRSRLMSTPRDAMLQLAPAPAQQQDTLPWLTSKNESHDYTEDTRATIPPLTPLSASKENILVPIRDMLWDQEWPSAEPNVRISSHTEGWSRVGEITSPLRYQPASSRAQSYAFGGVDNPHLQPLYSPYQAPAPPSPTFDRTGFHISTATGKPEHYSLPPRQSRSPFRSPEPDAVTFDAEGVFDRDPSLEADDETEIKPMDRFIREIITQRSPEILEAGVAKSMKTLEALKDTFTRYKAKSVDANARIEAIESLMALAKRSGTVVGVVGNTGAGKSSVINAMLDEERLVPTNCMRACTAVVTELSWNDNNDPNQKYRAEIEFISRADWENELKILLKEFLIENGTVSRETSDQNSDAGIAWAKFHAVYPKIHKENLDKWTVGKLMDEQFVLNVLGTTKRINRAYPDTFYTELQKYIDSKEKVTDKKNKEQKKPPVSMEYWPLIKVVKIYTKSSALSTGAVIVDLPGVHDSNAARAAVAERYMKKCTGLWIVAPITRAVDDKAAKTLLGDSFKRQLKYDGNFSSVTFVCSKTDDISVTEATESLELDAQISELEDQQRAHEKEIEAASDKIAELQKSIQVNREAMEEADKDMEVWEDLRDRAEEGKRDLAPVQNKRKRGTSDAKSRKRRQAEDDDSDVEYVSSDNEPPSDSDDDSGLGVQGPRLAPTQEDIKRKLEELKLSKKNARQENAVASKQITEIRPKILELKDKIAEAQAKMSAICIAGRNEYSKGAIQNDFAAGIKELDQEQLAEEDEEKFNPDVEIRDYEEVAQSLPVFCVSSRAYQKMRGRLKKDEKVPGFKTPEETELPQLQAHCRKITEAGRIQTCRTFLASFCQQLTALQLWASNDGTGLKMTHEDEEKQLNYLEMRLSQLEEGLRRAMTACLSSMKKELKDQIFDRFPKLIDDAVRAAPDTARKWGAHRDDGGLCWSAYMATCRRHGSYRSKNTGHHDFNAELMDPILNRLPTAWERAFQTRLPKALDVYTEDVGRVLNSFHGKIEEDARQNGVGLAKLPMLKNSIYNYEQMCQTHSVQLKAHSVQLKASMQESQKEANRNFVPTVANIMVSAYKLCTDEHGPGSFMRMKGHMNSHVDRERHHMFKSAAKTVETHLSQMCQGLREKMANESNKIFAMMREVLGGVQVSQDAMSKVEHDLKFAIKAILNADEGDQESDRVHVDQPEPANVGLRYTVEDASDEEL